MRDDPFAGWLTPAGASSSSDTGWAPEVAILLEDAWFDLGCGCEASTLGGLIVKVTCPRHGSLVPDKDRRAMLEHRGTYGVTYGPMDVGLETLAGEGERRRASTRHRGHRPTNR